MVVPWSIPLTLELWVYGILILIATVKNWSKPEHQEARYNNLLYGIMYLLFGGLAPMMFRGDGLSYELENRLFMFIFLVLITIDAFWWLINITPNFVYCHRHPEEKANRQYCTMVEKLRDHKSSSVAKDITRKFLHVLMMAIVIGVYVYARENAATLEVVWENYWAFSKFVYIIIAYAFCNMFVIGDLIRMNAFHGLPRWARKWYSTSLECKEAYTFITSIPYILIVSLFIWAPIQVLFVGVAVSAIGDGLASVIGKVFGRHKFPTWMDPKKSFEGLLAGCMGAMISSFVILTTFPLAQHAIILAFVISTACTLAFALIDMFSHRIQDNITNVFFPCLITWTLGIIFGAF